MTQLCVNVLNAGRNTAGNVSARVMTAAVVLLANTPVVAGFPITIVTKFPHLTILTVHARAAQGPDTVDAAE